MERITPYRLNLLHPVMYSDGTIHTEIRTVEQDILFPDYIVEVYRSSSREAQELAETYNFILPIPADALTASFQITNNELDPTVNLIMLYNDAEISSDTETQVADISTPVILQYKAYGLGEIVPEPTPIVSLTAHLVYTHEVIIPSELTL